MVPFDGTSATSFNELLVVISIVVAAIIVVIVLLFVRLGHAFVSLNKYEYEIRRRTFTLLEKESTIALKIFKFKVLIIPTIGVSRIPQNAGYLNRASNKCNSTPEPSIGGLVFHKMRGISIVH